MSELGKNEGGGGLCREILEKNAMIFFNENKYIFYKIRNIFLISLLKKTIYNIKSCYSEKM